MEIDVQDVTGTRLNPIVSSFEIAAKTAVKANFLAVVICALLMLTPLQGAQAQYAGAKDSYSKMLDMTRTWNQNLWSAQSSLDLTRDHLSRAGSSSGQTSAEQGSSPAHIDKSEQTEKQFPITATDFTPPGPAYVLPDQIIDSTAGLTTMQKAEMRSVFLKTLTTFEKQARKDNIANAFAFVATVSFQIRGRNLTEADTDTLIAHFNEALAKTPQYNALPPQQKQILYESLIITGGIIAYLETKGKQTNNLAMRTQANQLSAQVLKQFLGIN